MAVTTQPLIHLRSIKLVSGTPGDLVVKSKLSPCNYSAALRQLTLTIKGAIKYFVIQPARCKHQSILENEFFFQTLE